MSTLALSTRRVTGLSRTNALLMMRNRLTLTYAVVMPLLPLLLLFNGERGDVDAGAAAISTGLLMALMFPIYYNLLSMFVTRRDELVLKRLRTGEVTDRDLVVSMAAPGVAITLVVTVLTIVVAMVTGLPFPLNPVLLLVSVSHRLPRLRGSRTVDGLLDAYGGGRAADQPAGRPDRDPGPVRAVLPRVRAAVGLAAPQRCRRRPRADHLVRPAGGARQQ